MDGTTCSCNQQKFKVCTLSCKSNYHTIPCLQYKFDCTWTGTWPVHNEIVGLRVKSEVFLANYIKCVSEWLLFKAKCVIFHPYHGEKFRLLSMKWWWCPLCSRPTSLIIGSLWSHWNNSRSTRTHYSDSNPTSFAHSP